jgi:hypothetical protein
MPSDPALDYRTRPWRALALVAAAAALAPILQGYVPFFLGVAVIIAAAAFLDRPRAFRLIVGAGLAVA